MVFSEQAALRLRPALVAHHGVETANDLCADAIAYAWENWDRVRDLDNPVGYLYRVATSRARRYRRWRRPVSLPAESGVAAVEPDHGAPRDVGQAAARTTHCRCAGSRVRVVVSGRC